MGGWDTVPHHKAGGETEGQLRALKRGGEREPPFISKMAQKWQQLMRDELIDSSTRPRTTLLKLRGLEIAVPISESPWFGETKAHRLPQPQSWCIFAHLWVTWHPDPDRGNQLLTASVQSQQTESFAGHQRGQAPDFRTCGAQEKTSQCLARLCWGHMLPKLCVLSEGCDSSCPGQPHSHIHIVPLPGSQSLQPCPQRWGLACRGQRTRESGAGLVSPESWELPESDFPPSSIDSAERKSQKVSARFRGHTDSFRAVGWDSPEIVTPNAMQS